MIYVEYQTLTVLVLSQLIHFEILKRNLNYRNSATLTTNILPSLRKMEQNLQINGYTRHFSVHIFQYIESFPTVKDYSTSRNESPCRLCALKIVLGIVLYGSSECSKKFC